MEKRQNPSEKEFYNNSVKKVRVIPAIEKAEKENGSNINLRKKRVAAYARVSTLHEDQQSSYEMQIRYYSSYIQEREEWEFAGMYSDEGKSGTTIRKRVGFLQMMQDAEEGKIDLILTKSVSRFARNTVDSLTAIRKLKECGVECYFEKENIWTMDAKGELLLTIMSSLAQEESRSISENTRWGMRKAFQDGKVFVPFKHFLGYDRGSNGELLINEEQAKTVRLIYRLFLEGKTFYGIARELTELGILTPYGYKVWNSVTVKNILTNEKYKGDALLQKKYSKNFLDKRMILNQGEVPQYYIEGNHEAIIAPEIFERVQDKLIKRNKQKNKHPKMDTKMNVAVYARVSMDTERMKHSASAQVEYYRKMIAENPEWRCAGIYIDYGISGTGMKNREEFLHLLKDCEEKKVDIILVKSVSRFARNTVDLLATVRKLSAWGISVRFEEQGIDTMTEEGELMLTLLASAAQSESESISENAKWAVRKGFEQGKENTRKRTFGYQWLEGKMQIVPKEAEVVREIYQNYLDGKSHSYTVHELNERGIRSVNGKEMSVTSISYILRNIVYTGQMLLQKTYVLDPFSKKKIINQGELPQYLVEEHHEPIINMETFQCVQERLRKKREEKVFPYNRTGEKYDFTQKIVCGCCGRHYTRQLWKNKEKECPTWICTGKKYPKEKRCESSNIAEGKIYEACKEVMGMEVFDEKIFDEKVEKIYVIGKDCLKFQLLRGGYVEMKMYPKRRSE